MRNPVSKEAVVRELQELLPEFPISWEHPDCICVVVGTDTWWFGTANDTWGGDLKDCEDFDICSVDLGVTSGEHRPDIIARAIATEILRQ